MAETTDSWLGNSDEYQKKQRESEEVVVKPGNVLIYAILIAAYLVVGFFVVPKIWFRGGMDYFYLIVMLFVSWLICWIGAKCGGLKDADK